ESTRGLASRRDRPLRRRERAKVRRIGGEGDTQIQENPIAPATPALLRLQAAESLLAAGPHPKAVGTLYDVARLPNREIALATAEVVQRCLGVDLGLPHGQPIPAVNSRQAAEVTRRVLLWATQQVQQQETGELAPTN